MLGNLATAPVVKEMLTTEPHMNCDNLFKIKAILESNRSIWDNLPAFQKRMKEMPTPKL